MPEEDLEFQDLSKYRKKKKELYFPFTGIVGQQAMKKGLILVAANPRISSLIIVGENGTGKVTASLGIQDFLPPLEVREDCVVNCDPRDPLFKCTSCSEKAAVLMPSDSACVLAYVSAACADSFMTSPSCPVSISFSRPGMTETSTNMMSPPAGV